MNKVCITLNCASSADVARKLHQLRHEHDYFEVRLDQVADLSAEMIDKIFETSEQVQTIATIRTADEGGDFNDDIKYPELVQACFKSKASFIDVELAMLNKYPELKKLIQEDRTIISYHNFDSTPTDIELEKMISKMRELSEVAVTKIACMANSMGDVYRLIELQKSQPKNKAVIIAMGKNGRILRILGPSIGAFVTFASVDSSPVAPGQLYYKDMNKIISLMENK